MPVFFNGPEYQSAYGPTAVDVETLVTEVKDRLCIKSHERHSPGSRAMPYQRLSPFSVCHCAKKHTSSPVSVCQKRLKARHRQTENCIPCTTCKTKPSSSSRVELEDARTMLEKLLAEQSLIQEAVRRLQTQNLKCVPPSSCSSKKIYPFSSNDSIDTVSRFTPYSGSEDDSLSQHSVDL